MNSTDLVLWFSWLTLKGIYSNCLKLIIRVADHCQRFEQGRPVADRRQKEIKRYLLNLVKWSFFFIDAFKLIWGGYCIFIDCLFNTGERCWIFDVKRQWVPKADSGGEEGVEISPSQTGEQRNMKGGVESWSGACWFC